MKIMAAPDPSNTKPTRDVIIAAICKELEPLNKNNISMNENTDMTADLSVDSVATMEMVFALEEAFDVAIPLNELAEIYKVGELADLVLTHIDG